MPIGEPQEAPKLDPAMKIETIPWYECIGNRRPAAALIDKVIGFANRKFAGELGRGYWFRGVTRDKYELVPKAHRHYTLKQERAVALLFRQYAPMRHQACPALSDHAGWLCLMQHHGVPTRLLDWTYSLLIALYFAVRKRMLGASLDDCLQGCEGAVIWALDAPLMNYAMLDGQWPDPKQMPLFVLNQESVDENPERNFLAPLVNPVFDKQASLQPVSALGAIPAEANLRMLVQHSFFTIHRGHEALGKIEGLQKDPYAGNFLVRIPIPKFAIDELVKDLIRLGPCEATLFPDLDHLAQYWIGRKRWMDQVTGGDPDARVGY